MIIASFLRTPILANYTVTHTLALCLPPSIPYSQLRLGNLHSSPGSLLLQCPFAFAFVSHRPTENDTFFPPLRERLPVHIIPRFTLSASNDAEDDEEAWKMRMIIMGRYAQAKLDNAPGRSGCRSFLSLRRMVPSFSSVRLHLLSLPIPYSYLLAFFHLLPVRPYSEAVYPIVSWATRVIRYRP